MKAVAAVALLCCAACTINNTPRWYQAEPSPGQKSDLAWGVDILVLDPMTATASEVDDLHARRKKAVCEVGPERPETLLQLCRDKGFDAVTFTFPFEEKLGRRARELELPVLTAPVDSGDRRTRTGS